jgi:hypothetical protein
MNESVGFNRSHLEISSDRWLSPLESESASVDVTRVTLVIFEICFDKLSLVSMGSNDVVTLQAKFCHMLRRLIQR